jgi:predicted ATPase
MHNPNLFVITGGPGSGKTTVLMELEKCGFNYAPEVAREIIREQVRTGGRALPWDDQRLYTNLMLRHSIASYRQHTPISRPTFSDRGIPDTLCYARLILLADESRVRAACDQYRYASPVFFAPAWREIYATDAERKQDFDEAVRTSEQMRSVYEECGYLIRDLPQLEPRARAKFILEELQLPTAFPMDRGPGLESRGRREDNESQDHEDGNRDETEHEDEGEKDSAV